MDILFTPTSAAYIGESILSLYPALLKKIEVSTYISTLARFIIFPLLALLLGPFRDFKQAMDSPRNISLSLAQSAVNVVHIVSSHTAFVLLPIGVAMSLFYTYPIMIIVGQTLVGGNTFQEMIAPFVLALVAFAGVYLVATSLKEEKKKEVHAKGIIAALVAAITEVMLYMFIRNNESKSPFFSIHRMYTFGLLFVVVFGVRGLLSDTDNDIFNVEGRQLLPLFATVGTAFIGYFMTFFSIPRISVFAFSIISFVGIIASYLWGLVFHSEIPSTRSLLGSGLIALAIAVSRMFGLIETA